jgi:HSP20 family protein
MASLTKWSPFDELSVWPRSLFARFPAATAVTEWSPSCDVSENDREIVVHAELPGVASEDMDVSVQDSMLHIRGEKRSEEKREEDGKSYSERFFGSFERAIRIPSTVDNEKIEATLKDGVLEVRLPKSVPAESPQKKIQIKAS